MLSLLNQLKRIQSWWNNFSAAKEIEDAGGKALAVQCDIRFEDQIQAAIDKALLSSRN